MRAVHAAGRQFFALCTASSLGKMPAPPPPSIATAATIYNIRQCLASSTGSGSLMHESPATIVHRDDPGHERSVRPAPSPRWLRAADLDIVTDSQDRATALARLLWYSPILNEQLDGKSADLIVAPRDEAEVVRVAAACARHRVH